MIAIVGWTASGLVLATFCCERMVSLRIAAIASNVAFIGYACLAQLWPILALHTIMLPLNVWRLSGAIRCSGNDPVDVKHVMRSLVRVPLVWRERNRLRHELSKMTPHDFGDLPVPRGIIFDECRRWPWRDMSPQWGSIREWRRSVPSGRKKELE